ncbi:MULTISPECIES: Zn-dependent hydrolase [Rhizobium/Agrobacterium group]|uniref:Zn-dependent hydrolase n=1 Tax=Rhizobium/Agrobacterium group TaxID=227290 RepID=UPI00056E1B14|nr:MULTISPECIES: Zn-dependent hydrolase [Rhizobium/Agrobacterium group]AKC09801.1 N-carbamoyl-beta-alanine amidohydrolase [Agrobacterium tumefaciens]AYM18945.1 N-carbamoyl-beta-alanine amidohydrolase [Agrobacterium tumefaciens]AYM70244.1 N-carbamoyl-beta-alanine amidohydrolase [Agrobacterium tumefaciens]NIB59072.1 Zn-dependent hydrolase [Agrobacterium tumefaciens]NSZ24271.1 Zn-dependent hydrolase [Agrobacterium tumefaciens]
MTQTLSINGQRLIDRLDRFAQIGATAKGGVNRQALTGPDRQARQLLTELALQRGFKVFQDPIANLFIRREGRNPDLSPLLIGSHLDSQPTGGRFDGALGTLAAFEVLETLEDCGVETERPVEVVSFTNEEGCRFAPGCMGSMAFAAGSIPSAWETMRATDGALFADELSATLESLPVAVMRPLGTPVFAYLEVHIEQGPSLEKEGLPIGIVTGIQGTRWLEVIIEGQTAHAGTTALQYRHDPMQATANALAELYRDIMPADPAARFTIGRMALEPGAVNAIPATVRFTIDFRHPSLTTIGVMEQTIRMAIQQAAADTGCSATISQIFDMPPASFPDELLAVLDQAAQERDFSTKRMLSGAFHDALFMNRVAPSAMIFVPCRDGLSHNEAEYVEQEHSIAGGNMLLASLLQLLAPTGAL